MGGLPNSHFPSLFVHVALICAQEFDSFPQDIVRYAPSGVLDPAQDWTGAVVRMNAWQRTVDVRWLRGTEQAGMAGATP